MWTAGKVKEKVVLVNKHLCGLFKMSGKVCVGIICITIYCISIYPVCRYNMWRLEYLCLHV